LQVNNNKDLDVDPKKDEQSFFGSFFSAAAKKSDKQAKKNPMEAPPPVIKPQTALSERETMETEVISELQITLCDIELSF
jgi:dynamin 1-like protein